MSDEEILNKLLEHSKDGETLPTVKYLKKNHIYTLYWEVNKRYNGYFNFAAKFGKKVTRVDTKLCTEENIKRLFNLYLAMIDEFEYIPNDMIIKKNEKYKIAISIQRQQFKGRTNSKIAFIQYCIDSDILLPIKELNNFSCIFNEKNKTISNHTTQEQKTQAKELYNQYISKFNIKQKGA